MSTDLKELLAAFPIRYLPVSGTVTIGGQQVIKGKDDQCLWYWPQDAKFSKPGLTVFEEERQKMTLFPDMSDEATYAAVLRILANRVGMSAKSGVIWIPKTKEIQDKNRGSVSKVIAGWSLHTLTRQVLFPLPEVKDDAQALVQAITMSNCACGRGPIKDCPSHGESKARPWR